MTTALWAWLVAQSAVLGLIAAAKFPLEICTQDYDLISCQLTLSPWAFAAAFALNAVAFWFVVRFFTKRSL